MSRTKPEHLIYTTYRLKDSSRPGCAGLVETLANIHAECLNHGLKTIGVFTPLFGLASNEVYFMVTGSADFQLIADNHDMTIVSRHRFKATIRPDKNEPLTRPGVYIFRWFTIKPGTAQDIIHLSAEAWPAFEAEFETEVQGLFVEDQPAPERMLLLTWYRDLSVWEASRNPAPAARENFLKRHQLTTSATPIATLLATSLTSSRLISHT